MLQLAHVLSPLAVYSFALHLWSSHKFSIKQSLHWERERVRSKKIVQRHQQLCSPTWSWSWMGDMLDCWAVIRWECNKRHTYMHMHTPSTVEWAIPYVLCFSLLMESRNDRQAYHQAMWTLFLKMAKKNKNSDSYHSEQQPQLPTASTSMQYVGLSNMFKATPQDPKKNSHQMLS